MNLSTLENRLHALIKGSRNFHNQRHQQHVNSASAPVGTMIPTPGMSHSVNSSMMVTTSSIDTSMSAANTSIAPRTVNTGNPLPTGGMNSGSFIRSSEGIFEPYSLL